MIKLKEFLECIEYKITEGSEYHWHCFGENVYELSSWDSNGTQNTINCVFDKGTHELYTMEAWDYPNRRSYRWINPDYIAAVKQEYKNRNLDFATSIDNEKFIDIDLEEDILEKARAISKGEEYDTRVQVELTLDDAEMLQLMTMAHKRDITLNQMVEIVLQQFIDKKIQDAN